MAIKTIPDGFHKVTPYLTIVGVPRLLQFVGDTFDAVDKGKMTRPDGTIMHAQVMIGDSMIMMGECPPERTPSPAMLYVYVSDCDAVYAKALAAGGESVSAPADMYYGDRHGGVLDPCGNTWWIAQHKEDLSDEEMSRRHAERMRGQ
ncbi:MAG: VOC family protein [Phycisphaerales bacterium]|nr:VOC family protein [Phycisphaerales bacterium]